MDCYGKYNKKEEKCLSCKYSQLCKESKYPTSWQTNYSDIEYAEEYSNKKTPDLILECRETVRDEMKELSLHLAEIYNYIYSSVDKEFFTQAFFESVLALKKIAEHNTKTLRIVLIKILNPDKSLRQIAKMLECDFQLVDYHLKTALKIAPEIQDCILIDTRFYPKEKPKKKRKLTDVSAIKFYQVYFSFYGETAFF